MSWFNFWMFLHIAAAIVAFGPSFVFPLMGIVVRERPAGLAYAMVLGERIEERLIVPFALSMPVSGVGLILTGRVHLFQNGWLLAAIAVYLIALAIAFGNQLPAQSKLVHLTENLPPGPPSAEITALLRRAQVGGMLLTVCLLVIIFLMVFKPGGLVTG